MNTEIMNIVLQVVVFIAAGIGGYLIRNIHETSTRMGKTETEIENLRNLLDVKVMNLGERLDEKINRLQKRGDELNNELKCVNQSIGASESGLNSRLSRIEESLSNAKEAVQRKDMDFHSVVDRAKELDRKIYRVSSDLNNTHLDIMKMSNQIDGLEKRCP